MKICALLIYPVKISRGVEAGAGVMLTALSCCRQHLLHGKEGHGAQVGSRGHGSLSGGLCDGGMLPACLCL